MRLNKETTITAANSSFKTQKFFLVPNSIYALPEDSIEGIITPFTSGGGGGGSSDIGWIIAVSVIGGLLVIGGVGYFFWRRRKLAQESNHDGEESEGGLSLQE